MTTQTFEAQAITDEELLGVTGGYGRHKPFAGALQNLQMADQADRKGFSPCWLPPAWRPWAERSTSGAMEPRLDGAFSCSA